MIPQNNPLANYLSHKPAINAAISSVLASGHYILGAETTAFEQEFAAITSMCCNVQTGLLERA